MLCEFGGMSSLFWEKGKTRGERGLNSELLRDCVPPEACEKGKGEARDKVRLVLLPVRFVKLQVAPNIWRFSRQKNFRNEPFFRKYFSSHCAET